ncbi:MAG: MBL fold metallo-hydrolase [Verrucomicrobia bacterium]|nr:MBL fold metallo-hydrolase [Verrucomicrobiota bacterium]
MTPPPPDHFNGKTAPLPPTPVGGRFVDVLRWKLTSRPAPWPTQVPLDPQPPPPRPQGDELVATWIGHSTFLLQTAHGNFLTDPVFSNRASPVPWAGPRRAHAPGLAFESLPRIDVVLVSHDHYDHCDLTTLRRLAAAHDPLFIAPLRHADLLRKAGARRLVELDLWQTHPLPAAASASSASSAATATLTPARHWSNRLGSPRNHRLWGGFALALPAGPVPRTRRIWFAGDSGYDEALFREIGRRTGAPDLALVPIGAYEPRWFMAPMHMDPAEAVRAHLDVGARLSLGMHWGTFQLTDEAREDPVRALAAARQAAGLAEDAFKVMAPGASVTV